MKISPRRLIGATIVAALLPAAAGVAAPQAKSERDAPPQLISIDGNAPKWKNIAELRRYAELGDPQAQFEWGDRLLNGDGVTRDAAEALAWFEKAARNGVGDASFRLGKMYHDGLGAPRDYAKSFEHYTEAARRKVPQSFHNLGAMLVSARGVKRDYVEGLAWLIVATKSGAVSMAEQQTRERLAKRPNDIAAAEARAKEILATLASAPNEVTPRATVAATPGARPTLAAPTTEAAPKKVPISAPPKLEAPKPEISPAVSLPLPGVEPPKPAAPKAGG